MDTKKLGACVILDSVQNEITVASLWQNSSVLFIFLRHFACIDCRAHAVKVWKDRRSFESLDLRIVFLGSGAPYFISSFRESLSLDNAEIYTDPGLKAYQACEFHRSVGRVIGPRGILNGLRLFVHGHRQSKVGKDTGDLWQLGGIVLIEKGEKLLYQYASSALGDYPETSEILAVL